MGTLTDKLSYLNGTKSAIKNAITDKGGTVAETDTFRSYAAAIASLPTDTSNITDSTVEHIVFPEECQVIENATLVFAELDDCVLMPNNMYGSSENGLAGTVTKIWRDTENEADEIKFKVIVRGR
jgi:hypothetical protein